MTTLVEVFTKKIINMIPQQAYEEAAQKLIHEICETIYKDKKPREEIVEIVENFIKTHLNNSNENLHGIRDAIENSISKTTLSIYNNDHVNVLLLKKIISEDNGVNNKSGIFYKSLEQGVSVAKYSIDAKINDTMSFAKIVLEKMIDDKPNDKMIGGIKNNGITLENIGDQLGNIQNNTKKRFGDAIQTASNTTNELIQTGKDMTQKSENLKELIQTKVSTPPELDMSNIHEIPNIDLNVLGQGFNGLKEPIAEELVKKIQEKLPDKTIDSITVKRDIYKKILLVIQAHLQSEQGKEMLLSHINNVIQPEIDMLSNNNEIKKRLLKVIFKSKISEIYKK